MTDLPKTGFVKINQILTHIPVGRTTWWTGVKSGKYPTPIKLGANTTVWKAEDIHDLIARLAQEGGAK